MKHFYTTVMSVCLAMLLGGSLFAAEYHVNLDGSGDFAVIQDAIDAAQDGDVIIVHPGTYYENIHFLGKNIVLRSVDPEDRECVESTIIDGNENGTVVTFAGTEDETCELSGLTITNGLGKYAGGIYNSAGATIRRCIITQNSTLDEYDYAVGGITLANGLITHCEIMDNYGRYAGGIDSCGSYWSPTARVHDCVIANNRSRGPILGHGVGVGNINGEMRRCVIAGNEGAGVRGFSGHIDHSVIIDNEGVGIGNCRLITNSIIEGNGSPSSGGGVAGYAGQLIWNCWIQGNSTPDKGGGLAFCSGNLINCLITGNTASEGGGVWAFTGKMRNCTIADNTATVQGGGVSQRNGDNSFYWGQMLNIIIWGNEAPSGPGLILEYPCADPRYSCIQGWRWREDNIDLDPLFCTGPYGDYYLSSVEAGFPADSPCIDAGYDTARVNGLSGMTTSASDTLDTGTVDMGYHYPTEIPPRSELSVRGFTSQETYYEGDELVVLLEGNNAGPEIRVDVYLFADFVYVSSSCYFTGDAFTEDHVPWLTDVFLPAGTRFEPGEVFRLLIDGPLLHRLRGRNDLYVFVCQSGSPFILASSRAIFYAY